MTGHVIARKIYKHPHAPPGPPFASRDDKNAYYYRQWCIKQMQIEVSTLSALKQNHTPGVVEYLGSSLDGPDPSLWCSYAELDLSCFIDYWRNFHVRLPEPFVRHVLYQTIGGMAWIHAAGFVHRDVSPDNLLLEVHEQAGFCVKIGDFGHSCSIGGGLDEAVGKTKFLPPEALNNDHVPPAVASLDVWSVALVGIELISTGVSEMYNKRLRRGDPGEWSQYLERAFRTPHPNIFDEKDGLMPGGVITKTHRSLYGTPIPFRLHTSHQH
ncbi:STE/STE20/PAKA protein kinase [Pseudohyphozyma bogoriensis]|nr:STE/STE20/PAKA protein kinase [Pseudohyphozyma bogoriensis]